MSLHAITFVPSGRGAAQCPPNPAYPNGLDANCVPPQLEGLAETCTIALPYPAPECGHHDVVCRGCGLTLAITAAGRPDDPRSVRVPCLPVKAPKAAG